MKRINHRNTNYNTRKGLLQVGKRRGNGTGSVYRLPSGKWRGAVTLGQWIDDKGKLHRKVVSKNFDKKRDAVQWVSLPETRMEKKPDMTLKDIYDLWKPTYNGSDAARSVYQAAWGKYTALHGITLEKLNIDALQGCIDNCGAGRQTKGNMISLLRMLYKYAIPRGYTDLNLADYLKNSGGQSVEKEGIPLGYLEKIPSLFGKVPYAEYIYSHCYLGFRPGEFRELDVLNYDRKEKAVVGGFKTEAGRDRTVTISPKIQPIIDKLVSNKIAGPIFCDENGKELSERKYKKIFDSVLEAIGLDNPEIEINGRKYTKYTPHSCRHTFATLMMKTHGEMGDRLSLIGHANEKTLHHYEDIDLDGLREITNKI